ncbi:MAG TPA: tetratricopeptide repeat protein [Vicinamibacteria bacterium]|nr:tetratricopeptide repeat protein [Vicinamibacteria bacterium]
MSPLLALLAVVARAPAQELPPPRDPRQLEVIDGSPSVAAPADERRARIAEALRTGAYDRAEELLLEAAEAQPRSAEVLRQLAGVFLATGRPLNAAVALKKAEAIEPLDEPGRFTLVMSYVALGRRGWARPELARLVEAAPANPLYPYWVGRLDYDDGQYATAVESFRRALELDPRFMRAYDNLGLCYEALGRFDEALRSWEEAIRLNEGQKTKSPWPPLNLGLMLTRLDRLDEAEARFRESLRCDPRFPQAHYQLGITLEKKRTAGEAVSELEEAVRLDPAYSEAQYALARLYRRSGQPQKADQALQRFQELKQAKDQKDRVGPGP